MIEVFDAEGPISEVGGRVVDTECYIRDEYSSNPWENVVAYGGEQGGTLERIVPGFCDFRNLFWPTSVVPWAWERKDAVLQAMVRARQRSDSKLWFRLFLAVWNLGTLCWLVLYAMQSGVDGFWALVLLLQAGGVVGVFLTLDSCHAWVWCAFAVLATESASGLEVRLACADFKTRMERRMDVPASLSAVSLLPQAPVRIDKRNLETIYPAALVWKSDGGCSVCGGLFAASPQDLDTLAALLRASLSSHLGHPVADTLPIGTHVPAMGGECVRLLSHTPTGHDDREVQEEELDIVEDGHDARDDDDDDDDDEDDDDAVGLL